MKNPEDPQGFPNGKKAAEGCCDSSPEMGGGMMGMMKRFCKEGTEEVPWCCSMMEKMMGNKTGNTATESSKDKQ
jgi:hypothetical protein